MFLEKLETIAFDNCKLNMKSPILVGVSGGADSLALLEGLNALGFSLVIAHLDHSLRSESRDEAEFVRDFAASKALPFYSQRVDVFAYAKTESQSIEEAARSLRYQFLFEQARKHHCQAVAVGHHADDQVETILMHFLRGAALPGLIGMPFYQLPSQWDELIPLVRPLLTIWKDEITTFVQSLGLTPCKDQSNWDVKYHRNRIRHELIPTLTDFNPQIKIIIQRMAEILQEEENYMSEQADKAFIDCLVDQNREQIALSKPVFESLPEAVKRRVLRLAVEHLRPGLRNIGFEVIKRGLAFIANGKLNDAMDLVSQLELFLLNDAILVKPRKSELPDLGYPLLPFEDYCEFLFQGKSIQLRFGKSIQVDLIESIPENWHERVKKQGPDEVWLDYDLLITPLIVRGRRAGDRLKPMGMQGHSQSLQDFFVNLKIPAQLRPFLPLVISGDEIVWVAGLRPSEAYKCGADTKRVLKIKIINSQNYLRAGEKPPD